jgi:hypothetical protein
MDNNGIACTLNGHEGRIKNIRYDPIKDEVVGDFYYRNSNIPTCTDALKVVGINNKAKKYLEGIINEVLEGQKKKQIKKELILS